MTRPASDRPRQSAPISASHLGATNLVKLTRLARYPDGATGSSERTFTRRRMAEGTPRRILIVEDNELNLKLLKDLLDYRGYETVTSRFGGL